MNANRLAPLLAATFVTFAVLLGIACASSDDMRVIGSSGSSGTVPTPQTCQTPNEGCECAHDGELVQCGEVSDHTSDGRVVCATGYRRCVASKWSRCDALDKVTQQSVHTLGGATGFDAGPGNGGASCSVCDPFCQQGGGVAGDGGITAQPTATFDAAINGPPGAVVQSILDDAGISLDGAIYHELTPDAAPFDPVVVTTKVNSVDVYFMLNTTVAAQASINQLAAQIPTVISSVQASVPGAAFGVGRYTNYQSWPYASQSSGNTIFANMQNINTNGTLTSNVVRAMPTNAGGVCSGSASCFQNTPYVVAQSTATALYAMATNEPLAGWAQFGPFNQPDWWYNVYASYGQQANAGFAPYIAANSTCAPGTLGAACFRPDAFHLVMVLQDAPIDSGPGGSFPYYQFKPRYFSKDLTADYTTENSWFWYYSPSLGGTKVVPALPRDNGSTQGLTIAPAMVGTPQIQVGNVISKASVSKITATTLYDSSAKMTCTWNGTDIGTGPEAYWDFTVPAGGTRYWFDTVGSAYDTVLYIIDLNSNKVMACADDSFAWLSQVNVGTSATIQGIAAKNSAILGDLPAGSYRLVLDKFNTDNSNTVNGLPVADGVIGATSQTGLYQINMWTDITDPRMGGNPKQSGISTPGYSQTLAALNNPALNAMVMSVEMSGVDCGQTTTAWEKKWTRWSLEGLANDTHATIAGVPQVFSIQQNGTPGPAIGPATAKCPAAANLGAVITNAIQGLTGNLAQPVTVRVVDTDNAVDFDGVRGVSAGAVVLTPTDIDDAIFVSSIAVAPAAGCTGPTNQAGRVSASGVTTAGYTSCGAGANPNVTFTFSIPPSVTASGNPQIFKFNLELYFGNTLSKRVPVVLTIPPSGYAPVDFPTCFDASTACSAGKKLVWGKYSWNSTAPCAQGDCIPLQNPPAVNNGNDADIEYYVTPSTTAFSATCTGGSMAEQAAPLFIARNITQTGATDLGAFLKGLGLAQTPYMRVRAHLKPTLDQNKTPVLKDYLLTLTCVDNE